MAIVGAERDGCFGKSHEYKAEAERQRSSG